MGEQKGNLRLYSDVKLRRFAGVSKAQPSGSPQPKS